MCAAE
jgi:hypothetical protein